MSICIDDTVLQVFGHQLVHEVDGKGGLLIHAIATKFRAEIMPANVTLDVSTVCVHTLEVCDQSYVH